MGAINQIQMSYVPEEDRVLLRLNTADAEEFRFWITRRYTALLAHAIGAHRAADPDLGSQVSSEDRKTVEQFKQQAAEAGANFSEGFQPSESYPLGSQPLLAHKLSYRVEGGKLVLTIEPKTGQGINLTLDNQLNFNFSKLLHTAVEKAEWGLGLEQLAVGETGPNVGNTPIVN